jgi:outer membrane protein assembly factor BamB
MKTYARLFQRQLGPVRRRAWVGGVILLAIAVSGGIVAAVFSRGPTRPLRRPRFTGDAFPNVDLRNSRDVGGRIDSKSVSGLALAWTSPLTSAGSYGSDAATPVISHGVIYSQDLTSNVEAIELNTGKVLWKRMYESQDQGPNGVAVAAGRVYGATADSVFALDQRTGREIWSVRLTDSKTVAIDMAPGYDDETVYVSTVPQTPQGQYVSGRKGTMLALNAATGQKRWEFQTIAARESAKKSELGGGGVWYTPAFDGAGGMYFGVGNPTPFPGTSRHPWGSGRPGRDLFTDSIVKLDARTGTLRWFYQLTPHDLFDWDLQDPPILVDRGDQKLVIIAGKAGIVLALDASTGKVVWRIAVGRHNGHDRDGLYAMRGEYSRLKVPATVFPGELGGVIAPMSTNGTDVFVPLTDHSATIASQSSFTEAGSSRSKVVAISIRTGKVAWRQDLPGASASATTVIDDLVFVTTLEGLVVALNSATGQEVWSATLPAGSNAGVMASRDDLIVPAGLAGRPGQSAEIVAFRIPMAKR